ncbi:MAG TPA: hypothetical protein ENL15_01130 [Firmicutes bacterium]|nr:hypothetical protein [Bacillota bacterium]
MKTHLYLSLFLPVLSLLISNCGPLPRESAPIVSTFTFEKANRQNSYQTAGVYQDEIYYVQSTSDHYALCFITPDGTLLRSFRVPRGNGPGEARHTMGVRVIDGKVYWVDLALSRLTIFSLKGEYIDQINFNEETGLMAAFDVADGLLYFHSLNKTYIGVIELSTGELLRSIPHPIQGVPETGDKVPGGILRIDPYTGNILIGRVCRPFVIEIWSPRLEKIDELTYPLENEYKDLTYLPNINVHGDMLISSLVMTQSMIYVPHITVRFEIRGNTTETPPYPVEVIAFDRQTRKAHIYSLESISPAKGFFYLLGILDGNLAVMHYGPTDSEKKEVPWTFNGYSLDILR